MPYSLYVLRSRTTGRLYIGTSQDVMRRLREHNAGRSRATKPGIPWELVHTEEHPTLSAARTREWYLKRAPGARHEKQRWIVGP